MGHTKTLKESQSQRETEKRKKETRQPARKRERGKKWTCWHDHAVHGRRDDPGRGVQALGDPQGGGSAAGRGTGLRALGEGGPDPEQLLRQVPALIDAPVHGHEALQARLVPDVGVVKAGVQHDHGEGQHVARVCIGQSGGDDWGIWAPRT